MVASPPPWAAEDKPGAFFMFSFLLWLGFLLGFVEMFFLGAGLFLASDCGQKQKAVLEDMVGETIFRYFWVEIGRAHV